MIMTLGPVVALLTGCQDSNDSGTKPTTTAKVAVTATATHGATATSNPGAQAPNPGNQQPNPAPVDAPQPGQITTAPGDSGPQPGQITTPPGDPGPQPGQITTAPGDPGAQPGQITTSPAAPSPTTTAPGAGDEPRNPVPSAAPNAKCTEKINYVGDPRSNAEINSIGEQTGKCPEPQRAK
ncbi:hypothetical protein D5S18_29330 [Nocardia panacis]|uniref:Uncharacterized protein n=2 Tax=Nocardia panacis TaxID=2340916 RepID=A0A3A4K1J9_9NOCA|nr:hypothetical protein D5S18_29330 [Nocardia panacis]